MLIPHLLFFGVYVGVKLLMPSLMPWLARETYMTAIISLWYPLIWTIGWISGQREPGIVRDDGNASMNKDGMTGNDMSVMDQVKQLQSETEAHKELAKIKKTDGDAVDLSNSSDQKGSKTLKQQPSYMRTTAAQKSRERSVKLSSTPRTPKRTETKNVSGQVPATPHTFATPFTRLRRQKSLLRQTPTDYWLRYWVVYASVQCLSCVFHAAPFVGRIVARMPRVTSWAAEAQLLFFVWIFIMDRVIAQVSAATESDGNVPSQDPVMVQASPLHMLHQSLFPIVVQTHISTSQLFSPESWELYVVSKTRRVLDLLVMVRLVSEDFKDHVLHMLTESRTLLLPSITLLMPSFITQFGVAYVQFIVPSAKSLQVKGKKTLVDGNKMDDIDPTKETKLTYLKYWVLHCLYTGLLTWLAPILWWIPLSTHLIYISWCYMTFPRCIGRWYEIVEDELIAFGLIEAHDKELDVSNTRTMRLLQTLVSKLPKADDADDGSTRNVAVNLAAARFKEGISNADEDERKGLTSEQPIESDVSSNRAKTTKSVPMSTPLADKTNKRVVASDDTTSPLKADASAKPETGSDDEDEGFTVVEAVTPSDENENAGSGLRRSSRRRKQPQRF